MIAPPGKLADGAGFEPAIPFPVYALSRRAPSTARPPIRPAGMCLHLRRACLVAASFQPGRRDRYAFFPVRVETTAHLSVVDRCLAALTGRAAGLPATARYIRSFFACRGCPWTCRQAEGRTHGSGGSSEPQAKDLGLHRSATPCTSCTGGAQSRPAPLPRKEAEASRRCSSPGYFAATSQYFICPEMLRARTDAFPEVGAVVLS